MTQPAVRAEAPEGDVLGVCRDQSPAPASEHSGSDLRQNTDTLGRSAFSLREALANDEVVVGSCSSSSGLTPRRDGAKDASC